MSGGVREPHRGRRRVGTIHVVSTAPSPDVVGRPEVRTVVLVDVTGFSARPNPAQRRIRQLLPEQLTAAFRDAHIDWKGCDYGDRGDGAVIVLPPETDAVTVLTEVLPRLATAVSAHNVACHDDPALRFALRAAVHWGTVHPDHGGFTGSTINETARLVDTTALRRVLRRTGATLAVAVSTAVYDNFIRHGYDSLRRADFVPTRVAVKGFRAKAWIHVPHLPAQKIRRNTPMLTPLGISAVTLAAIVVTAGSVPLLHKTLRTPPDSLFVEVPKGNGWASAKDGLRTLTVCDTKSNGRGIRVEYTFRGSGVTHSIGDRNGSRPPCSSQRTEDTITSLRTCESDSTDTAAKLPAQPEVCSGWVSQ